MYEILNNKEKKRKNSEHYHIVLFSGLKVGPAKEDLLKPSREYY